MAKIGYLGPPGTFSELALQYYLAAGEQRDLEPVCLPSLDDVLAGVDRGELAAGLVPLENSSEGAVNRTQDLLAHRFTGLFIQKEMVLPVEHHLLARPGMTVAAVRRVLSHPQALAQCRGYLRRLLPGALEMETASTAAAAAMVAASGEPWAAIGTRAAARACGLSVLAEKINDCQSNATRFVVLGRQDGEPGAGCKTSLIFSVADRPGELYSALAEFARRGINLTRIESRPARSRLGEYLFFIDLAGHRQDAPVKEALQALAARGAGLRLLGSYRPLEEGAGKAPGRGAGCGPGRAAGCRSGGSSGPGGEGCCFAVNSQAGLEKTGLPERNGDGWPHPAYVPGGEADRAAGVCRQEPVGPGLPELRRQIDAVDAQLVDLLVQRMQLVEQVGRLKQAGRIRDYAREEEVLRRAGEHARAAGVRPELMKQVFQLLIRQAVEIQDKSGGAQV
ncbi:prephenate dehydratase [Desulfotomaculum copahuensis]|uniref:Prephenate dehydratase n=1 Tax=Desulfotomaculum copahuensis TaxID=1838280 RepID=A0A1B7LJH6_9FIRM|nr:prephenate dehydratase [Desulfotomaculum copahuensis]OAT86714.1 hypothetical protein A6M21_02545 [Desulfotomaculum copahuensis]